MPLVCLSDVESLAKCNVYMYCSLLLSCSPFLLLLLLLFASYWLLNSFFAAAAAAATFIRSFAFYL